LEVLKFGVCGCRPSHDSESNQVFKKGKKKDSFKVSVVSIRYERNSIAKVGYSTCVPPCSMLNLTVNYN